MQLALMNFTLRSGDYCAKWFLHHWMCHRPVFHRRFHDDLFGWQLSLEIDSDDRWLSFRMMSPSTLQVCFSMVSVSWIGNDSRFAKTIQFRSCDAFGVSQHQQWNWNKIATLSLHASTKIAFEVQIAVVHISPSHPFSVSCMKLHAVSYKNNSNLHIHSMRFINILKYVRKLSAHPICLQINLHDDMAYVRDETIRTRLKQCNSVRVRIETEALLLSLSLNLQQFQPIFILTGSQLLRQ